MPAKFIVTKGRSGKYGFVLEAANGSTIVKSPPYETKRAALTALRYIQRNGSTEVVDDLTAATASAPAGRAGTPAPRRIATRKTGPAKRPAATRTTAEKAAAKRSVPRKAVSRKAPPKKAAGKKSLVRKSPVRKSVTRTSGPRKPVARKRITARSAA
ncbi:DUF1508 domain-containing protein [Streptomyces sp. SID3343]|uniref:DUF1508 domain-containing protein n=1 Tax=Streptomyces sp. SID3343 TaxID=2690260 RepID=UPI00136D5E21|nr:DUF1508 domain-containing protein [Streptomyces sp. SID3343]